MSLFTYINILRFRYVQFWNAIQIQCFEAVFFFIQLGGCGYFSLYIISLTKIVKI